MDLEHGTGTLIRPAAPGEFWALGELLARAYLDEGLLTHGARDPYLPRLRDVAARAACARVLAAAGEDGALLGCVTFVPGPGPMSDLAGEGEAEIRMLAVAPAARRRGVGEALVRACLAQAGGVPGCRSVVLCTSQEMAAAHRVYERLGFRRTPERDRYPLPGIPLRAYALTLHGAGDDPGVSAPSPSTARSPE